jgi:hypothetical protein
MMRRFMAVLNKHFSGYETKKNKMNGTCGTYGGHETCIQNLGREIEDKRQLGRPR